MKPKKKKKKRKNKERSLPILCIVLLTKKEAKVPRCVNWYKHPRALFDNRDQKFQKCQSL